MSIDGVALYLATSFAAYSIMWGHYYASFGPPAHRAGGEWAILGWDERQYNRLCSDRRFCMLYAAFPFVPFAVALAIWFVCQNRPRITMPAEAKEWRTR